MFYHLFLKIFIKFCKAIIFPYFHLIFLIKYPFECYCFLLIIKNYLLLLNHYFAINTFCLISLFFLIMYLFYNYYFPVNYYPFNYYFLFTVFINLPTLLLSYKKGWNSFFLSMLFYFLFYYFYYDFYKILIVDFLIFIMFL